jgi:hypothetical protein
MVYFLGVPRRKAQLERREEKGEMRNEKTTWAKGMITAMDCQGHLASWCTTSPPPSMVASYFLVCDVSLCQVLCTLGLRSGPLLHRYSEVVNEYYSPSAN